MPSSNTEYLEKKINDNVERDKTNIALLEEQGWRVIVIWECQLKKQVREESLSKIYNEITQGRKLL